MKKVLFALVAIALVFVSCKKTTEDKKTDPKAAGITIKMEVVGTPTATGAVIRYTPSDTAIYYAPFCIPTAEMSQVTAQALAKQIYDAIAEGGFESYAFHGVEEYDWEGEFYPGTKYTPVAIQIDEKNTVYETLYTDAPFTTASVSESKMTIGITYDGVDAVTFTPSGTDTYIYAIMDMAFLDSIEVPHTTPIEEVAKYVLDELAEYPEDYETGPVTENIGNWAFGTVTTGDEVWAAAAPATEGVVNGTMTTAVLTVGTPIAENAARQIPMNARRPQIRIARRK